MSTATTGLALEEQLLIPQGNYVGEVLDWQLKEKKSREGTYALLRLEITEGPFVGRKLFYSIGNNAMLGDLLVSCNIAYDSTTTAKAGLEMLKGKKVAFEVAYTYQPNVRLEEVFKLRARR